MGKERVTYIDMAAGIMILWMMLGHVCGSRLAFTTPSFYGMMRRVFFFFMPWFFYKSGMFFFFAPISKMANRGGQKLLKPFAVWSAVGFVVYTFIQLIWGEAAILKLLVIRPLKAILLQNLVLCNEPLWFLLTLFCVINIANIALKKFHPIILSLIGMCLGYGVSLLQNEYIPDIIANTATGLTFFCLGYYEHGKEDNYLSIMLYFIGFVIVVALLHSPFVDMRINQCLIDRTGFDYLLWFPACYCGIKVLNNVCKWLTRIFSFPILRFVGRNAMMFYVTHYIMFYILGYVICKGIGIIDGDRLWWLTFICGLVILAVMGVCLSIKEKKEYNR